MLTAGDTRQAIQLSSTFQVSLPSIRFDQDGEERKQNFKLCNIETAGGKCFSESAAGPIGNSLQSSHCPDKRYQASGFGTAVLATGMLGEFVHSQLSAKGVTDYRSKNRALHRLNDWLRLGRPEDLRACPKPIQTAVSVGMLLKSAYLPAPVRLHKS